MGAVLLEREALMRYFLVQSDSAVDFDVVLRRIGSVEQLLQPVKIPAEEPSLRCCGVFAILEDIEDRAIHDGQIELAREQNTNKIRPQEKDRHKCAIKPHRAFAFGILEVAHALIP